MSCVCAWSAVLLSLDTTGWQRLSHGSIQACSCRALQGKQTLQPGDARKVRDSDGGTRQGAFLWPRDSLSEAGWSRLEKKARQRCVRPDLCRRSFAHCSYINNGGLQRCTPAGKQAATIRPERKILTTCRHGYKKIKRTSLVENAGQAPICIMHSACHESAVCAELLSIC